MPAVAQMSPHPLRLDAHIAAVASPTHGAVATFVGLVRDHDPSVQGEVTHLEYSAHPQAQDTLERLAAEVEAEHGVALAVSHRVGLLGVGEPAIVAVAASAHRAQALAACSDLVERVKAQLPVWKREILADGSHTWVGIA